MNWLVISLMKISSFSIFLTLVVTTPCLAQWEQVGYPVEINTGIIVNSLFASGNVVFAKGETGVDYGARGYLWRSTNNGESWEIDTSIKFPIITSFASQGQNLILGAYTAYDGNVLGQGGTYFSSDEGRTWQLRNGGIKDVSLANNVNAVAWEGGLLCRGTQEFTNDTTGGLFLSTDSGVTWNPLIQRIVVSRTCIDRGNIMFSGREAPDGPWATYITMDTGKIWSRVQGIPDTESVARFVATNNILIGFTTLTRLSTSPKYYYSVDHGVHWHPGLSSVLDTSAIYSVASVGNTIFVCSDDTIWYSRNSGESWIPLGSPGGTTISVSDNYLFTLSPYEIWRYPLSQLKLEVTRPSSVGQLRIYPNPIQSSDNLRVALGQQKWPTTLSVCDITGKVMRAYPQKAREGIVELDVKGIPKGAYILILRSSENVQSLPFMID